MSRKMYVFSSIQKLPRGRSWVKRGNIFSFTQRSIHGLKKKYLLMHTWQVLLIKQVSISNTFTSVIITFITLPSSSFHWHCKTNRHINIPLISTYKLHTTTFLVLLLKHSCPPLPLKPPTVAIILSISITVVKPPNNANFHHLPVITSVHDRLFVYVISSLLPFYS